MSADIVRRAEQKRSLCMRKNVVAAASSSAQRRITAPRDDRI
jgi:hypothetical protein